MIRPYFANKAAAGNFGTGGGAALNERSRHPIVRNPASLCLKLKVKVDLVATIACGFAACPVMEEIVQVFVEKPFAASNDNA